MLRTSSSLKYNVDERGIFFFQSLQDGVCQQLGIDDVRFFVNVYGICLTSPPKVIEEYAQFGSLSKFFKLRKPVTLQHLQFIALQLAEALLYMVSLYWKMDIGYGSLVLVSFFRKFRIFHVKSIEIGTPIWILLFTSSIPKRCITNHFYHVERYVIFY